MTAARAYGSAPVPYALPRPRRSSLFTAVHRSCRSAYAVYLSLRQVKVSGLGLRPGAPDRGLRRPGQLPRRARRRRVRGPAGAGAAVYGAIVVPVDARAGAAVRAAAGLGPVVRLRALLAGSRSSCRTRCRASSPRCCGASSTCRPQPAPRPADAVGLPTPDLLRPDTVIFGSIANIAVWGGVGFNMLVLYTALRAIPPRALRGGPDRRLRRAPDRAADQDPADLLPALVMTTRLLDDRDAAGLQPSR